MHWKVQAWTPILPKEPRDICCVTLPVDPTLDILSSVTPKLLCLLHEECKVITLESTVHLCSVIRRSISLGIPHRSTHRRSCLKWYLPRSRRSKICRCLQCYITDLSVRTILFVRHWFVSILGRGWSCDSIHSRHDDDAFNSCMSLPWIGAT